MELETTVPTDAGTQISAPELAVTPEVATPETQAEEQTQEQPQESEQDRLARERARFERRMGKATAARYQEQARATQAEQRAAELAERLSQYETPQAQPQQNQPDPVTLARHIATVERITEKSNAVAKDGATRFPDFNQALGVVVKEAGALIGQHGTPTPLGEAVLAADDPAALLHYLGTHPEVASELEDLSPIQAARRLLRVEIDMAKPKEPKQSQAPKAISPVKTAIRDDGGLSDGLTTAEWIARRNKQVRG
jgi:hypothetical protein